MDRSRTVCLDALHANFPRRMLLAGGGHTYTQRVSPRLLFDLTDETNGWRPFVPIVERGEGYILHPVAEL